MHATRRFLCPPRTVPRGTMPIVVTLYMCVCVCVYFVTFEPVPGEKERERKTKSILQVASALTFVTGLDESSAGSTVEASAASARARSLGHDEIYGFGSYTDMCVHRVTRKRNVPSRSHMWLRLKGLSSRDTLNRGTRSGLEFHEK